MNTDSTAVLYVELVRPDPEIWEEPEMRRALDERDICMVYRFLQRKRGFSQQRIAALTGQSQPEVSAIISKGRKVTAMTVLLRIAVGLGIPLAYLGFACVDCPARSGEGDQRGCR